MMKFTVCVAAATLAASSVAFVPSQWKCSRKSLHFNAEMSTKKPTGTSFLPSETVERAKIGNPIEKAKIAKDPTNAWVDVYEYARKIRDGEMTWEEVETADLDTRLKYVGMLHRGKRTPGQFMLRLKVPNGVVNSDQMRFYADSVEKYGEGGVVDITTRQNIQLRGVKIEDAPDIIDGLHARNQTSFQSALDSVRNVVGSPLAGIDDHELVDTRMISNAVNDLISLDPITMTRGNPMWANCKFAQSMHAAPPKENIGGLIFMHQPFSRAVPRKFNIAISGSRDDYAHTHINDIGLQPVAHSESGEMGFNVVLGGYMSIKRVAESVDSGMWIAADRESVVTFCEAVLRIFRDESDRKDRQKARLMWLVEKYGVEDFKNAIIKEIESYKRGIKVYDQQPRPTDKFTRRELLGVHPQKQEGKMRVGILVPTGRLGPSECRQLADLADEYSDGEIRLTVEQNVILPNVDEGRVDMLLNEEALHGTRMKVNPGMIEGNIVSCTGAQFCGLALIETKANAESIAKKLESLVSVNRPIRIHWTGCPNSCAQVQAADIGLMGAPAKKMIDGKSMAVPGCKIFIGGRIGEDAHLALNPVQSGIPLDDEDLLPVLVDLLKNEFGAVDKK